MIIVKEYNAVYDTIECDDSTANEIYEYFTFIQPNHEYMSWKKDPVTGKKKRNFTWDGKIRLFKLKTRKLYAGLRHRLVEFCKERDIEVRFDFDTRLNAFSGQEALDYVNTINIPHKIRDYQLYGFTKAVQSERRILLSPTGTGKSLIIYLLTRFFGLKTLIIVPTLNLIQQMFNDFKEYGYDSEKNIHLIFSGQEKFYINKPIIVSTWQSIYDLPEDWFKDIDVVICDEVHGATAKSIKSIMEKLKNTKIRIGTTGTLDELPVHRLVLEGLFGPILKVTTTAREVEGKNLAKPEIKNIILGYTDTERKTLKGIDYQGEIDFLINHSLRNDFLTKLTISLEGNTLLLFRMIAHGENLYKLISVKTDRKVYLIYGKTSGEEREEIRKILEKETDSIIIASYGTFSTGVNIPTLRHLIMGSPYKSKIKVLQSIGRVLRRIEGVKHSCVIWDISDDLTYKGKMNITLKHMIERVRIYNEEEFDYQTHNMELK